MFLPRVIIIHPSYVDLRVAGYPLLPVQYRSMADCMVRTIDLLIPIRRDGFKNNTRLRLVAIKTTDNWLPFAESIVCNLRNSLTRVIKI